MNLTKFSWIQNKKMRKVLISKVVVCLVGLLLYHLKIEVNFLLGKNLDFLIKSYIIDILEWFCFSWNNLVLNHNILYSHWIEYYLIFPINIQAFYLN